mgnify:CR=1 FL=1
MKKSKLSPEPSKRPVWLIPMVVVGAIAAVLALVALVTGSREAPFTPQVTGAPRAELDRTSIDHGDVSFNKVVESVYRIRNVGDEPLQILGEPRVQVIEGC